MVNKDVSQFSFSDKKNLKLQTDSMLEYIENKKKKIEKKSLSTLSQSINQNNKSIEHVDLRQKVSNSNSINSNSSNMTNKFYKKIIQGQEFELEVHGKNETFGIPESESQKE